MIDLKAEARREAAREFGHACAARHGFLRRGEAVPAEVEAEYERARQALAEEIT